MQGRGGWKRVSVSAGVALLALVCGCATPLPPEAGIAPASDSEAQALEQALRELPGGVGADEARRVARVALAATRELAQRYRPLRPAPLGNLAYHLGLRERALCCHWAEDLLDPLEGAERDALSVHWVVAHRGDRWREHNAILLLPHGAAPEDGLVLDAWRNSGRLYWTRLGADRYPWQVHPDDARRQNLRCS